MSQTTKQTVVEVLSGTGVGMVGSWFIVMLVLHLVKDPVLASTLTVLLCTVWSLVRGFFVRRYFNRKHKHDRPNS